VYAQHMRCRPCRWSHNRWSMQAKGPALWTRREAVVMGAHVVRQVRACAANQAAKDVVEGTGRASSRHPGTRFAALGATVHGASLSSMQRIHTGCTMCPLSGAVPGTHGALSSHPCGTCAHIHPAVAVRAPHAAQAVQAVHTACTCSAGQRALDYPEPQLKLLYRQPWQRRRYRQYMQPRQRRRAAHLTTRRPSSNC
jgi:hypothetical protein